MEGKGAGETRFSHSKEKIGGGLCPPFSRSLFEVHREVLKVLQAVHFIFFVVAYFFFTLGFVFSRAASRTALCEERVYKHFTKQSQHR